ncbi:hypothetical protein QPK13_19635 [Photorhabdus tasmaniensis]
MASLEGISTLIIHKGKGAKIDPPSFILGINRFHALRKEINRITSRYQRDARKEKQFHIYQNLLQFFDKNKTLLNPKYRFDGEKLILTR